MTFDTSDFAFGLLWTGGALATVMAVTFVAGLRAGKHSVVDTVWGLLFVTAAATSLIVSHDHGDTARRWILAVMVVIWGVRLAVHNGRRSAGKGEDPRYEKLLSTGRAGPRVNAAVKIYLPQLLIAFLVSAPVQVGSFVPAGVGVLTVAGILVWGVGMFFEAVGDAQLERYKAWKKAQPPDTVEASVLDRGLWRYTRHPNYFGDACVWWGVFLVAAEGLPGVFSIVGPVLMTFLLTAGSGKKTLERSMATRPGYPEYMDRTSGFFPLPPKAEPAGPPAGRPSKRDIAILTR
ncbi:hypothetical protein CFN78_25970 [Amycolatopsis antarctica]|uniref:Uncharacterized protein n=1 Tax=Amycolatopsis antarctica TaxID=1854586 RepID=A0A263CWN3_9PSEU|nr:DUF1295 domain-containing protein [Amycolatopsis antarctica]OZM70368.1 hypothetical protein CFN78_25970 [Amycolatopsis antarctica]